MNEREDQTSDEDADYSATTDPAREEILNAAASAFMQRGFSGTSIDDVADYLGSTKGRIYHYYRSKTDIFIDVHLESLRQLLGQVGAIAARKNLPPERRLFLMCREHAIIYMTKIAYQKSAALGLNKVLLTITSPYQTEATEQVNGMRNQYENLFADTIQEGIDSGAFRQIRPRFATKPLLGSLIWSALWYTVPEEGGDPDVNAKADAMAQYCLQALVNYEPSAEAPGLTAQA